MLPAGASCDENGGFPYLATRQMAGNWIPASAGMTAGL